MGNVFENLCGLDTNPNKKAWNKYKEQLLQMEEYIVKDE